MKIEKTMYAVFHGKGNPIVMTDALASLVIYKTKSEASKTAKSFCDGLEILVRAKNRDSTVTRRENEATGEYSVVVSNGKSFSIDTFYVKDLYVVEG